MLPPIIDTLRSNNPFLRKIITTSPIDGSADPDDDVFIGRSEVAMWMRVVSSWVCMVLYIWSLIAPVVMPDRYVPSFASLSQDTY